MVAAQAADLPTTKAPPAPPPPSVFSWTGFYIGANAGVGFSNTSLNPVLGGAFLSDPNLAEYQHLYESRVSNNRAGFLGGAQIGYNWQVSNFVFGLEADIDYQRNHRSVSSITPTTPPFPAANSVRSFRLTDGWFGTVRPRVGLAIDRAPVFATGGLAFGQERSNVLVTDDTGTPATWSGSSSETRIGWTAGAGVEYAVTPNWTVKGEYLHVNLGSRTYSLAAAASNSPQTYTMSATENDRFDLVRLGVNYKF